MAIPIDYRKPEIDPRAELMRRLECAPRDHAEALLVAWETLQTAHDKGVLDMLQGLMGGRDIIAIELGKAAKSGEAVNLMRNAIALGGLLASLDPETLTRLMGSVGESMAATPDEKPPSLWQIFKNVRSEDGRRGLSIITRLLTAVGAATKPKK
jgi:uncharacterized protein YjgD (DUF1641 family)